MHWFIRGNPVSASPSSASSLPPVVSAWPWTSETSSESSKVASWQASPVSGEQPSSCAAFYPASVTASRAQVKSYLRLNPAPKQAMAGPTIEGLPDALAERRLQRRRIVRRRKQEAAMGRQAGGQAIVGQCGGQLLSPLPGLGSLPRLVRKERREVR